jgi:hypothetical protein
MVPRSEARRVLPPRRVVPCPGYGAVRDLVERPPLKSVQDETRGMSVCAANALSSLDTLQKHETARGRGGRINKKQREAAAPPEARGRYRTEDCCNEDFFPTPQSTENSRQREIFLRSKPPAMTSAQQVCPEEAPQQPLDGLPAAEFEGLNCTPCPKREAFLWDLSPATARARALLLSAPPWPSSLRERLPPDGLWCAHLTPLSPASKCGRSASNPAKSKSPNDPSRARTPPLRFKQPRSRACAARSTLSTCGSVQATRPHTRAEPLPIVTPAQDSVDAALQL